MQNTLLQVLHFKNLELLEELQVSKIKALIRD